ncbi:MAG: serine hydrolase domain-containing protein [Dehalococcoidia bacterium]
MARPLAGLLIALAAACLASSGSSQDAGAAPPPYDFSAVTTLLQNTVNSQGLDGASLILVKDGQVIYEEYFGSYTETTVVPIASSTKWLSAATFMTLVDDGLVGLDDPVSQYLPEWTGQMGAITMRQLWSHTSGLVDDHACMDDYTITLANCVEQIRLAGLVAPPGSQFYYGGASMQVAGRVAEVASGQPWAQLYQERLRNPMGFTFTGYGFTQNPRIAGGAFSHLHDYASLLQMFLDGGTYNGTVILSPGTVHEMQKDQTFGVPIAYNPHPDGRRYGIGEWRDIVDANGNAIQLSSQGKFGFSPWIDNQRGYLGVFLVDDLLFPNLYPVIETAEAMIRNEIDALDTFDTDGDGTQDFADTDDDGDGYWDADEAAKGSVVLDAASTPEHCDAVDNDGDAIVDEPPALSGRATPDPLCGAGVDADGDTVTNDADTDDDGDGFLDASERDMSTDELASCPASAGHDAWPPDADANGTANVGDVVQLFGSGKILQTAGQPFYSRRSDADASGAVNVGDVTQMFGGGVILTSC